ncbi:hypothetical protein [Nonomuraea bangladeshensis]|uniref:hypothetical protein n=1 Tax=Nonomuraea bangladeshensis TaxID=404385 RepID=UPI0031DB3747
MDTPFTSVNGRTAITSRFAVGEPLRELTWTGSAIGSRAAHHHLITTRQEKLHAELTRRLGSIKTAAEQP